MDDEWKIREVEEALDGNRFGVILRNIVKTVCLFREDNAICYHSKGHDGDHCSSFNEILEAAWTLKQQIDSPS